jgi:hypothetical protein
MKKKSNTLLYIAVSVGLIVAAIAATAILNKSKENASSDIRTKAGVSTTLRMTGTVAAVNESTGTFSLANVRFATSESNAILGTWTVTPPSGFSLVSLSPGTQLTMTIDPTTMLATSSTVTATQIIVER